MPSVPPARDLIILAMAVIVLAPFPRLSADVVPGVTAAGVQLGPRVTGPEVTPESLLHRVVLLEFWGVDCPPCIASMPALQRLHADYAAAGLVVIGAHAQGGPPQRVAETAKRLGITFPVVEHASVEGAMDFNGIPHCMLFDHTGACIYRGSPFEVHGQVLEALRAAPAAVLGGRRLEKLPELDPLLRDEASFGAALKRARGAASARDEATEAEAAYVVERLEAWGRGLLDQAREAADRDPLAAVASAQRCATSLKGTPLGVEAAELVGSWKKDRGFQARVRSGQQLARLEAMRAHVLESLGGGTVATPDVVAALPAALKRQMAEVARGVRRAAADSPYAARADEISLEFGLGPTP